MICFGTLIIITSRLDTLGLPEGYARSRVGQDSIGSKALGVSWPSYEICHVAAPGEELFEVRWDANSRPQLSEQQSHWIREHCEQRRQSGQKVENHRLYRVESMGPKEGRLCLRAGVMDYEEYLGMSALGVRQGLSLVISVATRLPDGWVLEQRSARVAEGRGLWHVKPSGHVHPPESPWQGALREAREELGLEPYELSAATWLGVIRSRAAQCLAVIYAMESPVSLDAVRARQPEDSWESDRLFPLPEQDRDLGHWLLQARERMTGIGHGTLLLAAARTQGSAWLKSTAQTQGVPENLGPEHFFGRPGPRASVEPPGPEQR